MLSKPEAGVVGGEFFFGAEVDAEEVADGVGVFVAIQAVRDDAAGVGLHVPVGFIEFGLDVADEGVHLFGGRLGYAFGRHFAGTEFGEDGFPGVAFGLE